MKQVRNALERERSRAVERLRKLGGAVAPEAESEVPLVGAGRDVVDEVQANEHREMGLVSRARLVERINQLTAALGRLAEGTYGVCTECGGRVEPGRLKAMPEAATCLGCQAALERANGGRPPRIAA